MATPTVPDLLSQARLARSVADLKAKADQARTEAVTGRFEDQTRAAKGDIGGVQLLFKALEDAKTYQQTLALAETRASQTQTALAGLTLDTRRISTDALSYLGRGDAIALRALSDDAEKSLYTVFSALNSSFGGRALFSGDAVDQVALGDVEDLLADVRAIVAGAADETAARTALDAYFNDPAGGFETTIYGGGAGPAPSVEIAPGLRISAGTKANAQPIKDLIRSLALIASYETLPASGAAGRDAIATEAALLAIDAEARVIELRAEIGVSESRIRQSKLRHEAEELILTGVVNQKTARDPYEAASALQSIESQLEAAYLVTSRLAGLSLANFLR